jgi:hypothetical protein
MLRQGLHLRVRHLVNGWRAKRELKAGGREMRQKNGLWAWA